MLEGREVHGHGDMNVRHGGGHLANLIEDNVVALFRGGEGSSADTETEEEQTKKAKYIANIWVCLTNPE